MGLDNRVVTGHTEDMTQTLSTAPRATALVVVIGPITAGVNTDG